MAQPVDSVAPHDIYLTLRRITKYHPFLGIHGSVAKELGVSLPLVTKRLKSGDIDTYDAFYRHMIQRIESEFRSRLTALSRTNFMLRHVSEQLSALGTLDSAITSLELSTPLPIPFDSHSVSGVQHKEHSSCSNGQNASASDGNCAGNRGTLTDEPSALAYDVSYVPPSVYSNTLTSADST